MTSNRTITISRTSKGYIPKIKKEENNPTTEIKKEFNSGIDYSYPDPEIYSEENQDPEIIKIVYKTNVNIVLIHEAIRKKFGFERSKLDEYKEQINYIDNIGKNDIKLSINDLKYYSKKKKLLESKIEKIIEGSEWVLYVEEAKPFLEDYYMLFSHKNKSIVIAGKKEENEEDKNNKEIIINLIEGYISIASKYIEIIITRSEKCNIVCPICETNSSEFDIDEDSGICSCLKCGWYRKNISKNFSNKEISSTGKNDYEDRENFYKAIIRFSCKQTKIFHEKLEEDLDEYFSKNGIPTGEEIRSREKIKGRKEGLDAQMMLRALSELSKSKSLKHPHRKIYADYYEDVWLIMNFYWGFEPNDIMHLVNDLMQMYDETQEEYGNLTQEERGGRDASLSTQVRLLLQLWALDYPCLKTDFKLPQRLSLENHQRLWKLMCQRTNPKWFREII